MNNEKFIGSWSLVSCEAKSSEGDVRTPYGDDPYGKLMYDAAGNLSVVIMARGRPQFESNDLMRGTTDELKVAFEKFTAYCGKYAVDEAAGTVTHHLDGSWFPNWEGTDQVRLYTFGENTLQLDTEPRPSRRASWVLSLLWERES